MSSGLIRYFRKKNEEGTKSANSSPTDEISQVAKDDAEDHTTVDSGSGSGEMQNENSMENTIQVNEVTPKHDDVTRIIGRRIVEFDFVF